MDYFDEMQYNWRKPKGKEYNNKPNNNTMAYEPKEGAGAIFKNREKTEDKHPEFRGNFKGLDGKMYNIALWIKNDKNGNPYFSMSQSPYQAPQEKTENNGGYMPF